IQSAPRPLSVPESESYAVAAPMADATYGNTRSEAPIVTSVRRGRRTRWYPAGIGSPSFHACCSHGSTVAMYARVDGGDALGSMCARAELEESAIASAAAIVTKCRKNRGIVTRLELDMHPPSHDVHGPAVRVVGRAPDVLVVRREPRRRAQTQAVE